ncbi:MAG: ribonuclease P protein component [Endomicrobium sp.]|jgi:ribonuclease P protein component|nr:ribonuclease P protein component [Endomicrobium sp.]
MGKIVIRRSLSKKILLRKTFSFTYFEKLHLQKDFNKVFEKGLRLKNKSIKILVYKRNDGSVTRRLGLVTPRKVGKAVIRNKVKRRLREIFRLNKHFLEPGIDLIFISRAETALLNYSSLKKNVLDLLKDAKFYMDLE